LGAEGSHLWCFISGLIQACSLQANSTFYSHTFLHTQFVRCFWCSNFSVGWDTCLVSSIAILLAIVNLLHSVRTRCSLCYRLYPLKWYSFYSIVVSSLFYLFILLCVVEILNQLTPMDGLTIISMITFIIL